jgi:hypothetical protein
MEKAPTFLSNWQPRRRNKWLPYYIGFRPLQYTIQLDDTQMIFQCVFNTFLADTDISLRSGTG